MRTLPGGKAMTGDEEPRSAGLEETVRLYLTGRTDSGYAIAKKAGISRQQFYRFVKGERGLTLDSLDKLCFVLGLELRPVVRTMPEEQAAKRAEFLKKVEAKRKNKGKAE